MLNQQFFAPSDLSEACSLLANDAVQSLALAGGTDVMVRFNRHRRRREETLVYLGKLGLDYIREEESAIVVGACAPLSEIADSPLIRKKLPLLAKACADMASPAVRNAATLGGNVVTNARHADGIAALTALNARVIVTSTEGDRGIPMDEFPAMPKREKLSGGGIVKHFIMTPLGADESWAWEKLRQRKGESRSVVTVSMRAQMMNGKCTAMRLVIGCMAPHPFVSKSASDLMEGRVPDAQRTKQVIQEVLKECNPATDARATAWYREKATAALIERVFSQLN